MVERATRKRIGDEIKGKGSLGAVGLLNQRADFGLYLQSWLKANGSPQAWDDCSNMIDIIKSKYKGSC